ncbi:MAG: WecB/TagA/CpsF family glycosyltransferase [Candidatus Shapirobacteria bacterium]|nr:WecB/TagA/CpsF family glycosyltransferase [Candidatus Shapirobacteria bacterium]
MEQKKIKISKNQVTQTESFDGNHWELWGVPIFGSGRHAVLKVVERWLGASSLKLRKPKWLATVNPEFMMITAKDSRFFNILQKTDLNVMDGIGLVWAREIQKKNLMLRKIIFGFQVGMEILKGKYKDELASGSDLMKDLCELAAKKDYKVYFLGGWENRAERTAKYFKNKYPKLNVVGAESGGNLNPLSPKLRRAKPDILFVAYGMKRQEEWIEKNLRELSIGLVMGVGRSFDYYSGELKRAPKLWRRMGFEWLYSLIREPKRWRRQLELPKFVWKVLTS